MDEAEGQTESWKDCQRCEESEKESSRCGWSRQSSRQREAYLFVPRILTNCQAAHQFVQTLPHSSCLPSPTAASAPQVVRVRDSLGRSCQSQSINLPAARIGKLQEMNEVGKSLFHIINRTFRKRRSGRSRISLEIMKNCGILKSEKLDKK